MSDDAVSSEGDDAPPASVLMLSGDLMFASRVKAAADRAGMSFQMSGAMPDENTDSIRFVILDLSTRSGLVQQIVQSCAEKCPDATLIAYGPHVHVDRLTRAREAGIANVMTNGQFDSRLSSLFQ